LSMLSAILTWLHIVCLRQCPDTLLVPPSFPTRRSSDLWAGETSELEYNGQEYDWIFLDEATQFTWRSFQFLGGLLRGVNDFPKRDRKSTRLNSSHVSISYAVFCLKKKNVSI